MVNDPFEALDYLLRSLVIVTAGAAWTPGAAETPVKLIADRDTGKLPWGQFVGRERVLARVNTLAAMLMPRTKVEGLFYANGGYTPLFSSVRDPFIVAARVLLRELRGAE